MPSYQKQPLQINFSKGLDTKTDPWQVQADNFLVLNNMIFTTGGRLTKRNGYGNLSVNVNTTTSGITTSSTGLSGATFLTTFNENLTAVGQNLLAYSSSTGDWTNQGTLQPVELSVLPLVRSNTNQTQVDTAVSSNGLVCTVYTDQTPTSLSTPRYLYTIANAKTGQTIIAPTAIPIASGAVTGSPRVFCTGSYFIIVFTNVISAVSHLQFVAISVNTPTNVTANADIASAYVSATSLSWDGVVVGNKLYVAYNTTTGGQSIKITYINSNLTVATPTTYSNSGKVTATLMSLTADTYNPASPIIWASYYDSVGTVGYTFAVDQNLNKVISTPVEIIASGTVLNIATAAYNGNLNVFYEVSNNYGYDSSIPSHYIKTLQVTQAGTAGSTTTLVRSVGLASKAFIYNGSPYFLSIYSSSYQPTYFLLNSSGNVVARFAYQNAGSYYTVGLPGVAITGNIIQIGYLYKDLLESESSFQSTGTQTTSNIYAQTGLNLISLTLGTSQVAPTEIAEALHLSGGFLWMYDGVSPVEHNFFLYPDSVEGTPSNSGGSMVAQEYQYQAVYTWTDNQGNIHRSAPSIPIIVDMSTNNKAFTQPTPKTPTGTGTSGQTTITVSSATGLAVGQIITDTTNPTYIQLGTYITDVSGTTLTLSQPLAGSPSGDTLSISALCSVSVNIPTLRLTYKTSNPVKIELYRWSTAQEAFYQVTQIQTPLINSTTSDYVTFSDTYADNQILGNSLLYTTGGVIENIGAPSFIDTTLFDDRLWGIDAEDQNLLWYSKQVIETTPVEMSDLFTLYIAPSIGSQGSTGPLTCIAPMDDKLILFKQNAIYYINGTGPDNTGANSQYSSPFFITSAVGCTNPQSVVVMQNGLMFQSDKGIWLLGRDMTINYIGAPVEALTLNATVESALSIPKTTQVRFVLNTGITLMYDYFYMQWGTFSGVAAISATLYNGYHTLLNSSGSVFQETPGTYVDGSNPVLMNFTTAWLQMAGILGYQRTYFFYMLGEYLTPHFMNIGIAYDFNTTPEQTLLLQPSNFSPNYGGNGSDSASPYGQQSTYGGPGNLESWRGFLTRQRCHSIQLQFQEIYDPSFGVAPGPGLYITGLKLLLAVARSFRAAGTAETIQTQSGGGNQ